MTPAWELEELLPAAARVWLADAPAAAYYYWLDDPRAPDFAKGVEIHRKPGYDPAELFFDPFDRFVKPRAASYLLRKRSDSATRCRSSRPTPSVARGFHG